MWYQWIEGVCEWTEKIRTIGMSAMVPGWLICTVFIIPHMHRAPVDPWCVKVQWQSRQVQGKHVRSCTDSIVLLHSLKIGPWSSKSESQGSLAYSFSLDYISQLLEDNDIKGKCRTSKINKNSSFFFQPFCSCLWAKIMIKNVHIKQRGFPSGSHGNLPEM